MPINAFPISTVPPAANLISYVPFGVVTATDVQAAIQQLTSAIPSPGTGTDPLFLTQGFSLNTYNPTWNGDPNFRYASRFNIVTDCKTIEPGFGDTLTASFLMTIANGQATYSGLGAAKETFANLLVAASCNGSGQRNLYINNIVGYGMSDVSIGQDFVTYYCGPVQGDEGQGWKLNSRLYQGNQLYVGALTSVPTKSTLNTTLTQVVNRSKDIQTVTVANVTTGTAVGNWVVIGQEAATGSPNMEAVKLTAVGPINVGASSISGIFRTTHANGETVTPALRLVLPSSEMVGQDRVIVNLTKPSYSTGFVTAIAGGGYTGGGGANWSVGMVGGHALNIGAISLAADDYTGSPFDAGANRLRSWYQITAVFGATSLGIHTYSVAGDNAYRGKGPPPGGSGAAGNYPYIIRQAAKILHIVTDASGNPTLEVICETSTSTWTALDIIEQVFCPYPDVTGFQYTLAAYTNGGTYRSLFDINNGGPRTFSTCFAITDKFARPAPPDGDLNAWGAVFYVDTVCDSIMHLENSVASQAAIRLSSGSTGGGTDVSGKIYWAGAGQYIMPNTANLGMDLAAVGNANSPVNFGMLKFAYPNTGINTDLRLAEMSWGGYFLLPRVDAVTAPYIIVEERGGATTYNRAFFRPIANTNFPVLEIGTEKGGSSSATRTDISIISDGVEQLRLGSTLPVKFSAAPSFSANASVATVLGSVGPSGASTTVQKWLTIVDNTGAARYIPCF